MLKPKGGVRKTEGATAAKPPTESTMRKSGKRPAVLARKARALAAAGKLTPQLAKVMTAKVATTAKKLKRKLQVKAAKKREKGAE